MTPSHVQHNSLSRSYPKVFSLCLRTHILFHYSLCGKRSEAEEAGEGLGADGGLGVQARGMVDTAISHARRRLPHSGAAAVSGRTVRSRTDDVIGLL